MREERREKRVRKADSSVLAEKGKRGREKPKLWLEKRA
jgi:hypothetical protein